LHSDVRDASFGLTGLDLLQVPVGGGVVDVVVREKVRAAAAAIEAFVDEAGRGANAVGAANVGVVAVVVFGVDPGDVRGCLGGSAEETAVENVNGAVAENALFVGHSGALGVVDALVV
jgi:hypothetical protein